MTTYQDLISKKVNGNTTIFNTKTGIGYNSADQLAADLGVSSSAINWGNIQANESYQPGMNFGNNIPAPQSASVQQPLGLQMPQGYSASTPIQQPAPVISNTGSSIVNSTAGITGNITNLDNGITGAENNVGFNTWLEKMQENWDTSSKSLLESNKASAKLATDRQDQLAQQYKDDIARLQTEYGTDKATMEASQAAKLDPINRRLELLNGTYGGNAAVEQQLNAQKQQLLASNKLELDHLINQREGFIAQARSAFNDADYKLSDALLKNAQASEQTIYERQKDNINLALQFAQEQRLNTQQSYNQQKDAIQFAADNGITQPFYEIGGTVYRTSDNKPYPSPEQAALDGVDTTKWSNVSSVNGGNQTEQKIVASWSEKYSDSGILPTDSLVVAQQKLQNSKIYQNSVRLLDGGGGSGGGGSGGGTQAEQEGQFISDTRNTFKQGRGSDQKINPDMYRDAMYEYERRGYGTIQQFKDQFPPEDWINENNQVDDLEPSIG